ncbi:hypothetical protein B0H16DRAFT_1617800, partial [Mycena metata]
PALASLLSSSTSACSWFSTLLGVSTWSRVGSGRVVLRRMGRTMAWYKNKLTRLDPSPKLSLRGEETFDVFKANGGQGCRRRAVRTSARSSRTRSQTKESGKKGRKAMSQLPWGVNGANTNVDSADD